MPAPSKNSIFFHKRENFLKSDKYFEFIEKFSECLTPDNEIIIVVDDEELTQIQLPSFIRDIAIATGQPLNNIINMALNHLKLEWKYGNFYRNKHIIRLIRNFPDMDDDMKLKLIGHILNNIGENALYE